MSLSRLLLRNLLFHWRGNSAVFLGVVVGAAVLTGALFVGDSLRGSLRELTLQRLGWVDQTLIAPRFFRQGLAEELNAAQAADRIAPAILLQATARRQDDIRGVRGVTVLGVDERFWQGFGDSRHPEKGLWLTRTVAEALNVKEGDTVSLVLQKPSAIPRESLLGKRDDLAETWTLPVERVLTDADAVDHFSLRPGLDAPRTAFVPLALLQKELKLDGRINAILVGGAKPSLADDLHNKLDLDDWGLTLLGPDDRVRLLFEKLDRNHDDVLQFREWDGLLASSVVEAIKPAKKNEPTRAEVEAYYRKERNYLTLQSRQLFIEPAVVEAVMKAAKDNDLSCERSLVYLANTIALADKPTPNIPYSVIAAVESSFLPPEFAKLSDKQIVLARWPESPLQVNVGDEVTVGYFPPEHHGEPQEESHTFAVAGFVDLKGPTGDPDITPDFPGITDKRGFNDWQDLPFPFDLNRVKPRDNDYWTHYRTTPKAYVSLEIGQQLWGTRFGKVTSIRLAPKNNGNLFAAKEAFRQSLRAQLPPDKGGFVFDKVKADALAASSGGGLDFSELFLGFSCFLIVAALLLVGLLYRLNLDRRASEIGLLLAIGYRRWKVLQLLLTEGLVLSGLGALVGCGLAFGYNGLLVRFLGVIWPSGTLQSFLQPHWTIQSLAIGIVAALLVSAATIFLSILLLGRIAPERSLGRKHDRRARTGFAVTTALEQVGRALVSLVLALGTLALTPWMQAGEERAETFFFSGGLLLSACLAAVAWWMRSSRQRTVEGHGWFSIGRLGIRNAERHPARSLLTAGLLASAAFLLVAVEAFRPQSDDSGNGIHSGSGGFLLLAESDQPILRDLNTDKARSELRDKLIPIYRDQFGGDNQKAEQKTQEALDLLKQTQIYAFRVHAGDDASCLNLYQPRKPRILGVPHSLVERGGFEFASPPPGKPWEALERDGSPYAAFGEQSSVVYMLHSGVGKTYPVPDEDGTLQPLRIDGLLQDSVFQSGLLVSEHNFLTLYPHQEGYNFFLIDVEPQHAAAVKEALELALADRGFEVTYTKDRLASYLAVVGTYLSTFQALGGLGLLLGSLGLAVVLLRGVWERRAELALLRALGYRRLTLGWLVLAENAFLLVLGLAAGTVSALAAVAPQLLSGDASVPWRNLLLLLALVLVVGLTAGAAAVARTLQAPLIPALRRE